MAGQSSHLLQKIQQTAFQREEGRQGLEAYEGKCRQLGLPVSATVAQELCKRQASVTGACLGTAGARALGHALACNTVIEELNLSDNSLDGQVGSPRDLSCRAVGWALMTSNLERSGCDG